MPSIKFFIIILLVLGGLVLIVNQAFLYEQKAKPPIPPQGGFAFCLFDEQGVSPIDRILGIW